MFDFLSLSAIPLLKGAIVLIFLAIVALGSIYFFGRNNSLEDTAEQLLSDKTGQKIDFTPDDPAPAAPATPANTPPAPANDIQKTE